MQNRTNEATFARQTLRSYYLYLGLARSERSEPFKKILTELAETSREQYDFWARKSGVRGDDTTVISPITVFFYRILRVLLGLTLTTKLLVGRKDRRVSDYKTYCITCTVDEDHKQIETFVDRMHSIIGDIEETRVRFFSNVVLGFNDALIELTGALVGFSFALQNAKFVSIAGLITGISASMSMAASAFLQARHEKDRSPVTAALFTGVSYIVIAILLVLPFLLTEDVTNALWILALIIVVLIATVSFYSSILLEKTYKSQFFEMFALSVGVSIVAFGIGHVLRLFIPV